MWLFSGLLVAIENINKEYLVINLEMDAERLLKLIILWLLGYNKMRWLKLAITTLSPAETRKPRFGSGVDDKVRLAGNVTIKYVLASGS